MATPSRNADLEKFLREQVPDLASIDTKAMYEAAIKGQFGEDLSAAIHLYHMLLSRDPKDASAWNNLGLALTNQAQHDVARKCHEKSLKLFEAEDNEHYRFGLGGYAMDSLYMDNVSRETVFSLHKGTGEIRGETIRKTPWPNQRTSNRKLRIGYCSWDFREHSVAYFILPILRNHDLSKFEVYCYSDAEPQDHVTAIVKQHVTRFRPVHMMATEEWADLIRKDEIDILVDLSGHTAARQLDLFSWRCAPVQVTYIGYPETTGLDAMDYRIVDAVTDPPGAEEWATEALVRLPRCFLCYEPAEDAQIPIPPRPEGQPFTFGFFGGYNKVNDFTLGMWADILKAAPETMLLMKNFVFQDPDTRKLCADRLEKLGIPEDRFELLGKVGKREHFEMYGRVDLALDSFPYNGTTTTCEALWMGTPVLTLMGDSHRSRVSASLLSAAGYSYVITNTREEYIETAIAEVKMSRMVPGPAIRRRMQESMLMDAEAHTRTIEDIYRKMWKRWCDA